MVRDEGRDAARQSDLANDRNMALDGMEAMLQAHYGPKDRNYRTKVHLIRYADDFVITGASKEVLEEAKWLVEAFLSERGLGVKGHHNGSCMAD